MKKYFALAIVLAVTFIIEVNPAHAFFGFFEARDSVMNEALQNMSERTTLELAGSLRGQNIQGEALGEYSGKMDIADLLNPKAEFDVSVTGSSNARGLQIASSTKITGEAILAGKNLFLMNAI